MSEPTCTGQEDCLAHTHKLTCNGMEDPYLLEAFMMTYRIWNPDYPQDMECDCGHPYHRHFDGYEQNAAVGCKYCSCGIFVQKGHADPKAERRKLQSSRPKFPEESWFS